MTDIRDIRWLKRQGHKKITHLAVTERVGSMLARDMSEPPGKMNINRDS
jgi:hypothetical protein